MQLHKRITGYSVLKKSLLFAVAAFALASCRQYVEFRGYAQGGVYSVKACVSGCDVPTDSIGRKISEILWLVDTTFSGYNKGSVLSRMNAGKSVVPGREFKELLSIAESYYEKSEGAFNVYGGPLFDIWGFGFKTDSLPDEDRILKALNDCRERKYLNFNAVAQGYSCDLVAGYLHSIGIHDMLVNIGEIYCEGRGPAGKPWSVGIDAPVDGNDSPGAQISGIWYSKGPGAGIVTSGNYRKFYVKDGVKYAHTIDPRTGYPVRHNLLSATVVAPTGADADALATWFMVVGFEKAREIVLGNPDIEACLITTDTIWRSPGF